MVSWCELWCWSSCWSREFGKNKFCFFFFFMFSFYSILFFLHTSSLVKILAQRLKHRTKCVVLCVCVASRLRINTLYNKQTPHNQDKFLSVAFSLFFSLPAVPSLSSFFFGIKITQNTHTHTKSCVSMLSNLSRNGEVRRKNWNSSWRNWGVNSMPNEKKKTKLEWKKS